MEHFRKRVCLTARFYFIFFYIVLFFLVSRRFVSFCCQQATPKIVNQCRATVFWWRGSLIHPHKALKSLNLKHSPVQKQLTQLIKKRDNEKHVLWATTKGILREKEIKSIFKLFGVQFRTKMLCYGVNPWTKATDVKAVFSSAFKHLSPFLPSGRQTGRGVLDLQKKMAFQSIKYLNKNKTTWWEKETTHTKDFQNRRNESLPKLKQEMKNDECALCTLLLSVLSRNE